MKHSGSLITRWLSGLAPTDSADSDTAASTDDPYLAARRNMVAEQLSGPGRAIHDPRVLAAMEKVPRHEFVPAHLRARAYEDGPLPIGYGQTISQPYVVAFMTEQLHPRPTDRVLEIGTGCGYQTAVLAELVQEVYSLEIVEPLASRAASVLKHLGYTNVHLRSQDGYDGWPQAAPYDAVVVTCAPARVPPPLLAQLREGGHMIIPIGVMPDQELVRLEKRGDTLYQHEVMPVRFVPMTGASQASV